MLFFPLLASFATAVTGISINAGTRYSPLDIASAVDSIPSERDSTWVDTVARAGNDYQLLFSRAVQLKRFLAILVEERQSSEPETVSFIVPASDATAGEEYNVTVTTIRSEVDYGSKLELDADILIAGYHLQVCFSSDTLQLVADDPMPV